MNLNRSQGTPWGLSAYDGVPFAAGRACCARVGWLCLLQYTRLPHHEPLRGLGRDREAHSTATAATKISAPVFGRRKTATTATAEARNTTAATPAAATARSATAAEAPVVTAVSRCTRSSSEKSSRRERLAKLRLGTGTGACSAGTGTGGGSTIIRNSSGERFFEHDEPFRGRRLQPEPFRALVVLLEPFRRRRWGGRPRRFFEPVCLWHGGSRWDVQREMHSYYSSKGTAPICC